VTDDQLLATLRNLADRVADARARQQQLVDQRDRLIVQARKAGVPVRTIGEHAGLSHVQVLNILERDR
jgi:hypothetical protein